MKPPAIAIHICADVLTTEPYRRWCALVASRDTCATLERLCGEAGIGEQLLLVGERATLGAVQGALDAATTELADDGLLVLTFSGHTERGNGPIEDTRWCLADGPIRIAGVAARLARLPATARVVVIVDSCYAAAIKHVPLGPQPFALIGGCQEEQTMLERARSEIIVRLEQLHVTAPLHTIKAALEDDTPDAERPCVWTTSPAWWDRQIFDLSETAPRSRPGSSAAAPTSG